MGQSILMIDEYFKNKHRPLLSLIAWYWSWMEFRLVFATANVEDPQERMRRALQKLTRPIEQDALIAHIDEAILCRVVVAASPNRATPIRSR